MTFPGGVRNRTTYLYRLAEQVRNSQARLRKLAAGARTCRLHWQSGWMDLMAENLLEIAAAIERDAEATRAKTGPKPKK